jgi:6-phosphogluconolactonase
VPDADVRVCRDTRALAAAAASHIAEVLAAGVEEHGAASIALSGGRTPEELYRRLALRDEVPWDRVDVYWGDERGVPHDDPRSNYRMARECLLDHVPVRRERVHAMPTHLPSLERGASEYERLLRERFAGEWPRFDLVLLGIGEDGHTASLFPHAPALEEARRWVVAASAPVEPRGRLTLTLPALTHARTISVLAAGPSKADALRRALEGPPDPDCPASLIRASRAPIVWWADSGSASSLQPRHG